MLRPHFTVHPRAVLRVPTGRSWNLKTKKARLEVIVRLTIAREEQVARKQIQIEPEQIARLGIA
jgi:hypothetical protein